MGRAAVRTAIQKFIQTAGITYVGTVYAARPTISQEQDYAQTMNGKAVPGSANGSNCVIVVNITDDIRTRVADQGRGAVNDTDVHDVALELWFASTGGTAIKAQQDYDSIVDGLVKTIRDNALLGTSTAIWSAGEFKFGVRHSQGEAYSTEDGLVVSIDGVIRFEAWGYEAGTGV